MLSTTKTLENIKILNYYFFFRRGSFIVVYEVFLVSLMLRAVCNEII